MTKLKVKQVDAFTRTPLCGNPAAVVFDAVELSTQQMQAIAREMNLSETVFILPTTDLDADYSARIFTPRRELPFAGHPTIAAVHAVIEDGRLFNGQTPSGVLQECGIGIVPVIVEKRTGGLFFLMTQPVPQWFGTNIEKKDCVEMLGCRHNDLSDLPPDIVSTGVKWLIVPLKNVNAVKTLKPNMARIEQICTEAGAAGITTFCFGGEHDGHAIHARTFAPGEGVLEDPVCGSGQGCIAAYIARYGLISGRQFEYLAEQGLEIQRPGSVTVKAQLSEGRNWVIQVGGQAVTVLEGEMVL